MFMVGKSPPAHPTQKSLLETCPCPYWKFTAPVTQFFREYMALLQLSLGLFAPHNNQTDKLSWRLKSVTVVLRVTLLLGSWTAQSSEGKMLGCLHTETQGKVCVCAQGTVSCVTRKAAGTAKWNSYVCWDCQMNSRVNKMENVKHCS